LVSSQINHDRCARDILTKLIVETLLAPEYQLRQASALLAFNVSWTCTQIRNFIKKPCTEFDEHWSTEMVAALCSAIGNENICEKKNDETAFRLVVATGMLIAFSSSTVVELSQVVDLEAQLDTLCGQKRQQHAERITKVCKEIKRVLSQ
jgi:hypothetical protein